MPDRHTPDTHTPLEDSLGDQLWLRILSSPLVEEGEAYFINEYALQPVAQSIPLDEHLLADATTIPTSPTSTTIVDRILELDRQRIVDGVFRIHMKFIRGND